MKIPNGMAAAPVRTRWNRGALLLVLGALAVLLSSVAIIELRPGPASPSADPEASLISQPQSQSAGPIEAREAAAAVEDEPPSKPQSVQAEPETTDAKPAATEVPEQRNALPIPVNKVIPRVPRSARETIRGTIRVSIRVIVDKEGAILAAMADDPGPSRYFERFATEASHQWRFAPADSQEQRVAVVRFHFTRSGTTARAISPQ